MGWVGTNVLEELARERTGIVVAKRSSDFFCVSFGAEEEALGSFYFQGSEKLVRCLAKGDFEKSKKVEFREAADP